MSVSRRLLKCPYRGGKTAERLKQKKYNLYKANEATKTQFSKEKINIFQENILEKHYV